MSAYMMSSEEINTLAYHLYDKMHPQIILPIPVSHIRPANFHDFQSWEELSEAMHLMNLEALRERYGSDDFFFDACDGVEWDAPLIQHLTGTEATKLLWEYRYQCMEGQIDESDLWKRIDAFYQAIDDKWKNYF
jgi:hypothetical protein